MDSKGAFREDGLDQEDSVDYMTAVKRLYRRMDNRIIPCLWTLYFLASASRSNVGLALTMNTATKDGLGQRLGLSDHQISTGVALFYVGYVIFEVPSNLVSMSPRQVNGNSSDDNASSCLDCKDTNLNWNCSGLSRRLEFRLVILSFEISSRGM